MFVKINNTIQNINANTIQELINELGLTDKEYVILLNGKLFKKTEYSTAKLIENDSIDIFSFVGGG